jgi:hypothetical protein
MESRSELDIYAPFPDSFHDPWTMSPGSFPKTNLPILEEEIQVLDKVLQLLLRFEETPQHV